MSDPTQLAAEQFAVGEVAIWNRPGPNFGKETTILSSLQLVRAIDASTGEVTEAWRYQIDPTGLVLGPALSKCTRYWAEPQHLRKKRPPRKDLETVRWSECPWQPESLRV